MKKAQNSTTRLTSLLSLIFFFSGFAALIYQVVWQRLLTLYYGVGTISITLIVSVYMVGLGFGALFGGYLAERSTKKITWYFVLEVLIGCFGLISLPFLDYLGEKTAGSNYVLSFVYMFLFLCVPTFLMGITLPLLTKIFNQVVQNFLNTVSFLYFINTIGAAAGAVFASYVVISLFGLDTGIFIAVAINFVLAGLILLARSYSTAGQAAEEISVTKEPETAGSLGRTAYFLVLITGFLAIGYELVWFRVVGVLVKASPYSFSTILAVYLTGIALGSYSMKKYVNKRPGLDKKSLFFTLQFLISVYVVTCFIGYYYLTIYTPFGGLTLASFNTLLHPPQMLTHLVYPENLYPALDTILWSAFFVLIPTALMGASFPLISSLALSRHDQEGKTIAAIYFFNICGNVLGGVLTGFLLLSFLGTETTLLIFATIGILFALFVSRVGKKHFSIGKRLAASFTLLSITFLLFPKGGQLYAVMHSMPKAGSEAITSIANAKFTNYRPESFVPILEEGRDGVIVTYHDDGRIMNYINGIPHGSRGFHVNHQVEVAEAASYAPSIENVLLIGYGTGDATKTVLAMEGVRKVTVIELNRELMINLKKIPAISKELSDERVNLIIDDGRRFLFRTDQEFDLILIDPIHPTTAYSNNLYSKEFFELIAAHLKDGGIFKLWINERRVMPKTLRACFDHVRMYKQFCLASNKPLTAHSDRLPQVESIMSQDELNMLAITDSAYVGDEEYIEEITAGYGVNRDWKPLCEYYLGYHFRERLREYRRKGDEARLSQ